MMQQVVEPMKTAGVVPWAIAVYPRKSYNRIDGRKMQPKVLGPVDQICSAGFRTTKYSRKFGQPGMDLDEDG